MAQRYRKFGRIQSELACFGLLRYCFALLRYCFLLLRDGAEPKQSAKLSFSASSFCKFGEAAATSRVQPLG